MEQIESFSYRIAARTEAAGKYDPNAPREGNEDSFAIIPNVGDVEASVSFDTITSVPERGVLMVVADGMGGHNAGEVASQIAVSTVKEMFAATVVSEKDFSSKETRAKYLEKIVKSADQNIRSDAESNPDRKGMGSTIVMAWIVGNELTVTWCGDSRAYRFHPEKGLEQLSEDHSMVQDMVRKKQLKYEETFSHPQGNIITHCLGGGGKGNAEPESRQFTLEDGDLVMLCSDGLSGVLFDDGRLRSNGEPYSEENIQDILSRKRECLKDTLTCLFDAARRSEWYDNVTAVLFEFNVGVLKTEQILTAEKPAQDLTKEKKRSSDQCHKRCKNFILVLSIVAVAAICFLGGMFLQSVRNGASCTDTVAANDSVSDESAQIENGNNFVELDVGDVTEKPHGVAEKKSPTPNPSTVKNLGKAGSDELTPSGTSEDSIKS